jgi:hypothetical protein
MLDQASRHAVLELHRRGQGVRAIARALQVSRAAVRDVLHRGTADVPRLARPEKALEHREDILRLLQQCEGSFTRVHEELTQSGLQLSYPALTAFCRRHGIGQVSTQPAGATTSPRARRCSTTPRRMTCTWAARSGAGRPPGPRLVRPRQRPAHATPQGQPPRARRRRAPRPAPPAPLDPRALLAPAHPACPVLHPATRRKPLDTPPCSGRSWRASSDSAGTPRERRVPQRERGR